MRILFDTSALVAALLSVHPVHPRVMPWFQRTLDGPDIGLFSAQSLAEAFGILGLRAEKKLDVQPVIARAMEHPGPVVIDFQVKYDENCYPMVPPGAALSETIDQPAWSPDELLAETRKVPVG